MQKHAIIIGGGFGGVRAALDLSRDRSVKTTLVSNNPNFEYYPGLHKIVGVSHRAVYQVPLSTIFKDTGVEIVIDSVTAVDPAAKTVTTKSATLSADAIVLAVGSQTEFFNIPGLKDAAYGFKSVAEAKKLRAHVEELFSKKPAETDASDCVVAFRFVVVGGGPNGVDLAGELAVLAKRFAKKYGVPESIVTIDLVEGGPRLLQALPAEVGERVRLRLRDLGVNVMLNRQLKEQDSWTIEFGDMKLGSKTLIWTAGVTGNDLVKSIPGFEIGKRNRVAVDDHMQAKGFDGVYVIGDIADTKFAGLAQTALYDGEYVARAIKAKFAGKGIHAYEPHGVAYNIGAGPRWSVMAVGPLVMYGIIPYVTRTLIDLKFFLSILPLGEVYKLFFGKR